MKTNTNFVGYIGIPALLLSICSIVLGTYLWIAWGVALSTQEVAWLMPFSLYTANPFEHIIVAIISYGFIFGSLFVLAGVYWLHNNWKYYKHYKKWIERRQQR